MISHHYFLPNNFVSKIKPGIIDILVYLVIFYFIRNLIKIDYNYTFLFFYINNSNSKYIHPRDFVRLNSFLANVEYCLSIILNMLINENNFNFL